MFPTITAFLHPLVLIKVMLFLVNCESTQQQHNQEFTGKLLRSYISCSLHRAVQNPHLAMP